MISMCMKRFLCFNDLFHIATGEELSSSRVIVMEYLDGLLKARPT